MSNMDGETYAELRQIVAKLWKDIEEGFDEIPRERFWWSIMCDPITPEKKRPTGDFLLPVPVKNRTAWLKAMNILDRFNVFTFSLGSSDNHLVQYFSLDEEPKDELYYSICGFSMKEFVSFCDRFDFDLSKPLLKIRQGWLDLNSDNVPIITIENVKYYFPPLNSSTFADMLKIALQPSLRNVPLDKNRLNKEGEDENVVTNVLGGEKFHLGDSVKRLRKYRIEIDFPEVLDLFHFTNDKMIVGKV